MENVWTYVGIGITIVIAIIFLANAIKIIRPTHVGAMETLGKYTGYKTSGLVIVIPFIQKLRAVNITERLVDVEKQDVITKENLNCKVDAQVYYKIHKDEENMKNALYNVNDVTYQIVELAQSTLRAVIGQKMFKDVNADRQLLNKAIFDELTEQTKNWGIQIVRVELKEIFPPADVQDTMNEIIKAENVKDAKKDLAEALRIQTRGEKDAMIIDAEGKKQSQILNAEARQQQQEIEAKGEKAMIVLQSEAEKTKQELIAQGKANAIKSVAEADARAIEMVANATAEKYKVEGQSLQDNFQDTAIEFKKLDTMKDSYQNNSKFIIADQNQPLTLLVDETSGTKKKLPFEPRHQPKGNSKPISEHKPIN